MKATKKGKTGRISVTEALKILLPTYQVHDAAVQLTMATHANKCRLWCNGNLLAPDYIAKALKIVAHVEKDGRVTGDVVSSTREAWQPQQDGYRFELDTAEVKALLPKPAEWRRGPVLKHDWRAIDIEIVWRCIDQKTGKVRVPESQNKLAEDVLTWLQENGKNCPAKSEMDEAVKDWCAPLRKLQK
jgi:hypothetical protein